MRLNKKEYNEILSRLENLEKTINKGGGNPYHDELGRFTEGPSTAFGEYDTRPSESMVKYYSNENGELSSRLEKEDATALLRCIATGSNLEDKMYNLTGTVIGNEQRGKLREFFNHANTIPRDTMTAAKMDFGETSSDRKAQMQRYQQWASRAGTNIERATTQASNIEKMLASFETQAKKQGASEVLGVVNRLKGAVKATKAIVNTSKYLLDKVDKSKSMHNVVITDYEKDKNSLVNKADNLIAKMDKLINGGKGSGNFGHSGRPGKVGGSGNGGVPQPKELIGAPDSSLGVLPEDFKKAKTVAKRRGGNIEVKETDHKTYTASNKFYEREFDSKREAKAFKDGYDYAKDERRFQRVDYVKTKDDKGTARWDVMYKGTDYGVGEKAGFKNPIEAQRWAEGYNAFMIAAESEVPSDKWIRMK